MKRFLLCLIVFLMLLTSCGKKSDPYVPYLNPSVTEHLEETLDGEDDSNVEEEETEFFGHSEPYSFEPCEGVFIDVPRNALFEDTKLTFDRVTEETPELKAIMEEMYENEYYPVGVWEVDAGLGPDECLPGKYSVSIDLSSLHIDPSLYDFVEIVRIDENNRMNIIDSSVSGSTLTYSSNRNSIIMAVIIGLALAPLAWPIHDYYKSESYYIFSIFSGQTTYVTKVNLGYVSFEVQWIARDLEKGQQESIKKAAEIKAEYMKKIKGEANSYEKYDWDLFGMFSKGAELSKQLYEMLMNDAEYQNIVKKIQRPVLLDKVIESIIIAFEYLKKEAIMMPTERVRFNLNPEEDNLGTSVWNLLEENYVNISMRDAAILNADTQKGQTQRDNLLLTVTHELFHVCQTYYHTHLYSDSTRFDEMTAVALESDARDYYFANGIIKTKPDLTDQDHWGELYRSIDSLDLANNVMQMQGYNLSLMIPYLRKVTGKNVTIGRIMNMRAFDEKPNTTEPLMKAFQIKGDFSPYWIGFCKEYADRTTSKNSDPRKVHANKPSDHQALSTSGDYTMKVKGFAQINRDPLPLLVVADDPSTIDDLKGTFFPAGPHSRYKNGYYLPALREVTKENNRRYMIEVYGKQDGTPLTNGYTIWGMGKTSKAEIDVSYTKNLLYIWMSEYSELANNDIIEGYRILLKTDNGYSAEGHKTLEEFHKGITISFDKLYNGDKTKDVIVTVTLTEYVSDDQGNHFYGIESDPVSYTLKGIPESEEEVHEVQETEVYEPDVQPVVEPREEEKPQEEKKGYWRLKETNVTKTDDEIGSEGYSSFYYSASETVHSVRVSRPSTRDHGAGSAKISITCTTPPQIIYPGDKVVMRMSVNIEYSGDYMLWGMSGLVGYGKPNDTRDGIVNNNPTRFAATVEGKPRKVYMDTFGNDPNPEAEVYHEFKEGSKAGAEIAIQFATSNASTLWIYEWVE